MSKTTSKSVEQKAKENKENQSVEEAQQKSDQKSEQINDQNKKSVGKKNGKQENKQENDQEKPEKIRRFIIIVCSSDYIFNLPEGTKTKLFGATLDEHAHRKIMDVVNKIDLNVRFLSADVFDNKNTNYDLGSKIEQDDIVAIVSPFVFFTSSKIIEEAIKAVLSKKDTISTIGDERDYIATFGIGKMVAAGTEINSCNSFLTCTKDTGAVYTRVKFLEKEKSSPSSRMDYFNKIENYRNDFLDYVVMSGVDIENRDGVVISPSCVVRSGTKILPNTQIYDNSLIKEKCVIGPNTVIINSQIGEKSIIENSKISDSVLDYNVTVESHSVLKNNCQIENGVKIYSGCSIENSSIGVKTSVYHNSMLVETKTGQEAVIGSGTVTVKPINADAKSKTYQCRIGNYAIIGCNSTLIEPIEIGNGALVAAGSVITDKVSDNAFAIAREFQETKENKAKKRKRF